MGYSVLGVVVLLVAVVVVVTSSDSTAQWNNVMDVILDHAKMELRKRGRQDLELKDVDRQFDKKFAFLRLRGNFQAEGGWLKDLTTARRVGDVSAEQTGSVMTLGATVSWDELALGYRHYRLDIGRVFEGDMEVSVRSNAARAVFSFEMVDDGCKTEVVEIKILELSDLSIKIKGLGFLNFLAEQIVKWFVDSRKDDITSKLEEMFKKDIPEHLEDFHCDEYASLLMVPF